MNKPVLFAAALLIGLFLFTGVISPAAIYLKSDGKITCSKASNYNELSCTTNSGATKPYGDIITLQIENAYKLNTEQFGTIYQPILIKEDATANKFFSENTLCYASGGKLAYKTNSLKDAQLYQNSLLKAKAHDETGFSSKTIQYERGCGNYWYEINTQQIVYDKFDNQFIEIQGNNFKAVGLCNMNSKECVLDVTTPTKEYESYVQSIVIKLKTGGISKNDICKYSSDGCATQTQTSQTSSTTSQTINNVNANSVEKPESIFAKFFSWIKSLFGGAS